MRHMMVERKGEETRRRGSDANPPERRPPTLPDALNPQPSAIAANATDTTIVGSQRLETTLGGAPECIARLGGRLISSREGLGAHRG